MSMTLLNFILLKMPRISSYELKACCGNDVRGQTSNFTFLLKVCKDEITSNLSGLCNQETIQIDVLFGVNNSYCDAR